MTDLDHVLNSKKISQKFGSTSPIFGNAMEFFKIQVEKKDNTSFTDKYKLWKTQFEQIYGKNITLGLFLKHTYMAQLLLAITIITYFPEDPKDKAYKMYIDTSVNFRSFELKEISLFNWTKLNENLFHKIFILLDNSSLTPEDLFVDLYQEVFYESTRHKIGEFYTPPRLVDKMITESYDFGEKLLDPSCGSGSFLIHVINKILNSEKEKEAKLKAINNVYGFDINPLATLTTKFNILLNLEIFNNGGENYSDFINPNLNIYLLDSLFPEDYEKRYEHINFKDLLNSFDQVIGNPPWLTYKDLQDEQYQDKIRKLATKLNIKPESQYITHIELSSVFFYAIPKRFLKIGGEIFFVVTKSLLNGDHCYSFRAFSIFKDLEIWDFPGNYFFNVDHICLKGTYIGENNIPIEEKYPLQVKIFNDDIELLKTTKYSSLKLSKEGAKIIKPIEELEIIQKVDESQYKTKFKQGATLVPKSLVFFEIKEKEGKTLTISSDKDILARAKKKWKIRFENEEIEDPFHFMTFLNRDMIPFYIKEFRNVFLPIRSDNFTFDLDYLKSFPKSFQFYMKMNKLYKEKKKETSKINDLISNLNYWNKLTKQVKNKPFLVVYNSSGSTIKSSVIDLEKNRLIIGSQNYYFSTDSMNEAYYLCSILNAPILSKYIKIIKSSRHIHKRPFSFPIAKYSEETEGHKKLALISKKCHSLVHDIVHNNKSVSSEKVRLLISHKLIKINELTNQIIFKK